MNNAHRPARAMRAQLIALLALFSFSFLSAEPFGQAPQCDYFNAISRYGHQVWTEDNGLPQNTVTSFLQTPDGYIWMGTQEGLVRFDGERFDVFDRNTNPELKMNFVTTLAYTPDGTLWIGTEGGGLSSYKAGAFKNYASVDGFSATAIPVVAPSADGSVWVGTGAKGVAHYQNGKFTYLTTSDGLPSNDIHALHEDRNGTLWIGTDKGAATYSNGKVSHPDLGKTFADKLTMTFYEPPTGSIWIGTSYGLVHVAGKTVTSFTTADGLTANYVTAVGEDSHGDMWIGTGGAGLNRMSCGMISTYQVSDGLSNDQIGAVMIDKEDNVWVGTNGGGLNRFHGTNFHAYGPAEGLGGNFAFSILEDHAGNLWIGTAGGGLNKFSNGKFTHYTTKEGLPTNFTMGLYEDAQSNIWVGTFGGGLSKLSNGKFTTYTAPSNLSGVSAMTGDGSGGMWIGTRDGLDHLVNGTFTNYGMKDGLTATRINCLLRDSKGNLWIGSHGGGVDMMKDGKFTNYSTKNILPCDEVYAMLEDRDGTIWIGTDAAGLCRLKYGKITTYTMKEGLFDDQIFSIVEDGSNNLWMSSNRGVFRVNVDDLNKFADGSLAKITSISYGKADGMRSRECDGGYQPAAWRAHDGSFWFPTVKGIVNVDPEHLKINTQPPSVSIEQFLADNKDVDQLKSMSFAPGTNRFEFRYAGMSFTAPEFVKFKYKLEGFDNDWINAGTHRAAYYTNLPPGTYTFRVQASNSDGVWNTTGAAATFTLAPFFYQTSWFFGVCIIGLIVLAYGVHRLRLRHVRTNELVELVDERTRDLRIERDKTEAALTQIRSAHGKIREQAALLDRAQDAIFVLDFNYAIEFWNMGAERIYGWTPSQASGKNAIELLSTDKMPSLSEAYTAVHENGEWHGEVQHVTRSGKEIVVLSNWSLVLDDAGKPKSILVINTDITEKKKIEVQFLRSQRMQSVGTLAGGIAHDLNNVLSP
ncbi:MAG TPA: two-component regulator propeller domain-containing protein, partial [Bacteroidota bacterium]|nr:two-component regulator propeller domain-containing protein [Bacteroidota bacterium]